MRLAAHRHLILEENIHARQHVLDVLLHAFRLPQNTQRLLRLAAEAKHARRRQPAVAVGRDVRCRSPRERRQPHCRRALQLEAVPQRGRQQAAFAASRVAHDEDPLLGRLAVWLGDEWGNVAPRGALLVVQAEQVGDLLCRRRRPHEHVRRHAAT